MSLWTKPITTITFADVDEFCKLDHSEGFRLDYKLEINDKLIQTVAAMANGYGGLILVGVEGNKTTNMPVWDPPTKGMPMRNGLQEQLIQKCLAPTNMYPPLLPEVSPPIQNEALPGHAILVVRVPISKDAPHAVEKNRKVYIYDRQDSTNEPHLADMEYIEGLLRRRQNTESDREKLIGDALERCSRLLESTMPLRWASVIPYYPWRDLCTPRDCWPYHQKWQKENFVCPAEWRRHSAPGGSLAIGTRKVDQSMLPVAMTSFTSRGHFFASCFAMENLEGVSSQMLNRFFTRGNCEKPRLNFNMTKMFAGVLCEWADECYQNHVAQRPGLFMVSIGVENARRCCLVTEPHVYREGAPFPDDRCRIDSVVPVSEFLGNREKIVASLMDDLAFSFGL